MHTVVEPPLQAASTSKALENEHHSTLNRIKLPYHIPPIIFLLNILQSVSFSSISIPVSFHSIFSCLVSSRLILPTPSLPVPYLVVTPFPTHPLTSQLFFRCTASTKFIFHCPVSSNLLTHRSVFLILSFPVPSLPVPSLSHFSLSHLSPTHPSFQPFPTNFFPSHLVSSRHFLSCLLSNSFSKPVCHLCPFYF